MRRRHAIIATMIDCLRSERNRATIALASIRSPTSGARSSSDWKPNRDSKPRRCSSGCSRRIPASFPIPHDEPSSDGLPSGEACTDPARPSSFPRFITRGRLAASDFTVCNDLGVKIAGAPFDHTLFHCVLTYSNVESVSLCFSESFEALSEGIQKAFWEFGGVPQRHRTDSLSAAVNNHSSRKTLTDRYAALMDHYGCEARTNQRPLCQRERRRRIIQRTLKDAIDQALLLRGSRDFASRERLHGRSCEEIDRRANAHRRRSLRRRASRV